MCLLPRPLKLDDKELITVFYSYINGFAMHGMNPEGDVPDANRLGFIQKALDNANLLLQAQFASGDFRRRLRYSMVCCFQYILRVPF